MIFQKLCLSLGVLFFFTYSSGQTIQEVWKTDTIFKVPESVYSDTQRNVLYVSNIGSRPVTENTGFLSKVSPEGTLVSLEWITGLNAPKGLTMAGNDLYVAEVNAVAIIDVEKGTIKERIPFPQAKMLNDISASPDGDVYVSDTRDGKIYLIKNKKAEILLEGLDNPNGVLFYKDKLYFVDKGRFFVLENSEKKLLAEGMEESTDGIEPVGEGDFLISCWSGIIYYLKASREKIILLDTRDQQLNTADIGWNAASKIMYVPTFWGNNVTAYKLEE